MIDRIDSARLQSQIDARYRQHLQDIRQQDTHRIAHKDEQYKTEEKKKLEAIERAQWLNLDRGQNVDVYV